VDEGNRSDCPSFEELMRLMDGELSGERRREVRDHLERCPRCRSILATQERMEASWRESYRPPPESRFRRMRQRILERNGDSSGSRLLRFGLPVAAALVAALVGLRIFMPGFGSLLGTVDSPSTTAARQAEQAMDARRRSAEEPDRAPGQPSDTCAATDQTRSEQGAAEMEEVVPEEQIDGAVASPVEEAREPASEESAEPGARPEGSGEQVGREDRDAAAAGGGAGGYGVTAETAQPVAGEEAAGYAGVSGEAVSEEEPAPRESLSAPDDELDLVTDVAGLASAEGQLQEDDSTAVAREGSSADGMAASRSPAQESEMVLELAFDSSGTVSADRETMLDSLAPGWRDSLDGLHADTTLAMTLQRLLELLQVR
jgi:hypothetical protein